MIFYFATELCLNMHNFLWILVYAISGGAYSSGVVKFSIKNFYHDFFQFSYLKKYPIGLVGWFWVKKCDI